MNTPLRLIVSLLALLLFQTADGQQTQFTLTADSIYSSKPDSTLSPMGQVLTRTERMYFFIGRISINADQNFNTKDIEKSLPQLEQNLKTIRVNLAGKPSSLNLRNLQLLQILSSDMIQSLRDWRTALRDYNKRALYMTGTVDAMLKDPLVKEPVKDTEVIHTYGARIKLLKKKLASTDTLTSTLLTKIDRLQSTVSNDFFEAIDLRKELRKQLTKFGGEIFSAQYPYLWQPCSAAETGEIAQSAGEQKLLGYYFRKSAESRTWMLALGVAFFGWVFFNFRRIRKSGREIDEEDFKIHFLHRFPFIGSLIVMLALAPVFDLHPAAIYSNILQFWLLIVLTALLWRRWPRQLFYYWLVILALFLAITFAHSALGSIHAQRRLLLAVNIAGIIIGSLLYKRIPRSWTLDWLIRIVIIIFVLGNGISVVANITGRVLLAQIVSTAVIFGLTQIIALTVFMRIIVEAAYLQILRLRLAEGAMAHFSFEKIDKRVNRTLTVLCLILWLIVFAINLNIYDSIYASVLDFLNHPRTIGSTTFTYSSIALFFIIILIANFFQKNIGFLWSGNTADLVPIKRGAGSRLLFMRLVLLTIGFFLAVAASGLPIDKITIILGALSVGIGLGLQNIVHNLVSGIVLIFERPLEVGDSIEVGDKKGIVKEIGLRSTTLISGAGSEIIIPNGDFLAAPVVNWTLSNSFGRADLALYLPAATDLALANKLIIEVITTNTRVLPDKSPSITVVSFTEKRIKLAVAFWVNNIREAESVKSEVYVAISQSLAAHQIGLV